MKKLISIALALVMLLAFAACGSNDAKAPAADQSVKAESAKTETKTEQKTEAAAVKYPTRTIEIHTHKSGSTVEINTRLFTPVLSKHLNGVDIIVVNDDSMYTAFQNAINADPDGYVLSSTTCNVQLTDAQGGLTYDSVEDGKFIGTFTVGGGYFVALTKKFADENKVSTLDELIALTKANPEKYTISTSYGAISELATYSLIEDVGIDAYPVDLADSNTRLIAFLQGDLDIFVGNWSTIKQYVQTGEVVPLCYYGDSRSPSQPDIPCTKDLGYSVMPAQNYYYITAPKDTPDEIVAILTKAVEDTVNDPEYIEAIRNNNAEEVFMNSEDTYEMLKDMRTVLAKLMEDK